MALLRLRPQQRCARRRRGGPLRRRQTGRLHQVRVGHRGGGLCQLVAELHVARRQLPLRGGNARRSRALQPRSRRRHDRQPLRRQPADSDRLLRSVAEPRQRRAEHQPRRLVLELPRRHHRQIRMGPRRQRQLRDQHRDDGDDLHLLLDARRSHGRPARDRQQRQPAGDDHAHGHDRAIGLGLILEPDPEHGRAGPLLADGRGQRHQPRRQRRQLARDPLRCTQPRRDRRGRRRQQHRRRLQRRRCRQCKRGPLQHQPGDARVLAQVERLRQRRQPRLRADPELQQQPGWPPGRPQRARGRRQVRGRDRQRQLAQHRLLQSPLGRTVALLRLRTRRQRAGLRTDQALRRRAARRVRQDPVRHRCRQLRQLGPLLHVACRLGPVWQRQPR